MPGTTTAVILGGGIGRRFGVLTSREQPKALLPLANAPLLSYAVEWVAAAGLPRAIVVVAGEAAAAAVARWVAEEYKGPLKLSVTAVAEECGTATALRCVLDELAGCAQVAVLRRAPSSRPPAPSPAPAATCSATSRWRRCWRGTG